MKKLLVVLLAVMMAFGLLSCKSREQQMLEQAIDDFQDMTGQEQYSDMDSDDMDDDMEPNDDGLGDDYQNEQAGVDDGDGNYGQEGEIYLEDEDNSIVLGGGQWPEDAPDVVAEPVFGEAEITGVVSSSSGTVVTYAGVGRSEAAELIASYLADGSWSLIVHTNDSDWESYTGQNGDVFLTIDWDYGDFSILWEIFG